MTAVWAALDESLGHTVLTVELAVGVVVGLTFVALYLRTDWWRSRAGRLSMGNMLAWTLVAAGGLLYRLSWQASALTLLLPACAVVVLVQAWWVCQLVTSHRCKPAARARALAAELEDLAWTLAEAGEAEAAESAFKQSRALAALLPEGTSRG